MIRALALLLVVLALPTAAHAVTWNFTGEVVSTDLSFPGIGVGTEMTGRVTFDPTTPDSVLGANIGLYAGGTSIIADFGGGPLVFIATENSTIQILNESTGDLMYFIAHIATLQLALLLEATNLNAVVSDALPTAPPDLSAFINPRFQIAEIGGIGSIQVRLDTFTDPAALPEPATLTMVGSGIAALVVAARKRARRR